jgi:putative ABC transport system permease protein
MWLLDVLRYRWRVLTHPRAHEQEVAEELEFHVGLEAMQREHAAHGELSAREARFAAKRRLGNATYYQEESRRVSGLAFVDTVLQDIRFALRSFRRTPMFTAVTVLTLAVGIGANTAIFSAVDAVLLRPLPFHEPDRLMSVSLVRPAIGARGRNDGISWSFPKFAVFRSAQTIFSDLTLWTGSQFTVRAADEAVRVAGEYTDSRYLPTLGVSLAMGRLFTAEEDRDMGGAHVAIVSDELWRNLYNADPGVLGRNVDVDGVPYVVVGVAPAGFRGLSGNSTIWMPIASSNVGWNVSNAWNHQYFAVARLARGVSIERAKAIMPELGARVDAAYPNPQGGMGDRGHIIAAGATHWSASARPLDATRVDGRVRNTLFVLLAAVALVLLIACANVANLFLVRASARHREIAVRLAIGASRVRLVRQLLVESTLLSLFGGVASLAVAWLGVKVIAGLQPATALRSQNLAGLGVVNFSTIQLDVDAFAFAAVVALATGMLFGLVPAIQATRPSLVHGLKDDNGGRSVAIRGLTSRNVLTVVEIALSVVLLVGSGLMVRSLAHLMGIYPGFSADHVLTLRVNRAPAWSRDSISRFYDVAIERLNRIPGVVDVSIADCPPLGGWCAGSPIMFRDRPAVAPGTEPGVGVHWITPNWPSMIRVPLLRGRSLTRSDVVGRQRVVLVSETAARTFWPGQDPIGRAISVGSPDTAYVAGVIGDIQYGEMDMPLRPEVYISYYQNPFSYRMMLFIRTRGDPVAIAPAVRAALREVAPGFPMYDVLSLDAQLRSATSYTRVSSLLLTMFATLALALATIGTYGVISFAVAQRTREIGVRVALGATSGNIIRLVVGKGIALGGFGAAFGLTAAILVTRALRSMFYGVEPTDAVTLVSIVGLLTLALLAASWIPAARASRIPPVQALRGD